MVPLSPVSTKQPSGHFSPCELTVLPLAEKRSARRQQHHRESSGERRI